jgi:hypothetical protein
VASSKLSRRRCISLAAVFFLLPLSLSTGYLPQADFSTVLGYGATGSCLFKKLPSPAIDTKIKGIYNMAIGCHMAISCDIYY